MMKITTSKRFSFNLRDVLKALLIAVLTPVLVLIQNSLDAGVFTLNWKNILMAGLAGGLAYLIKNFFSSSKTVIKNEPNNE